MNWLEIETKWREMACRAQGIKPSALQTMPLKSSDRDAVAQEVARVEVTPRTGTPNQTAL